MRHARFDERHHVFRGEILALDDNGLRHLARMLVGHGDHRDVGDLRMLEQNRLELRGRDLESLDLDQLLQPIDHGQVAVVIEHTDVAGVQPALRIDRAGRRLGIVQVAFHDVRAAHPHFTRLADRHVLAGFRIDDALLEARHQQAHGAGALGAGHRVMRGRARFGHPVALADLDVEPLLDRVGQFGTERRRA